MFSYKRIYVQTVMICMVVIFLTQGLVAHGQLDTNKRSIYVLAWHSNGELLAIGYSQGDVEILDSGTGELSLFQYNAPIQAIAWKEQTNQLAIASDNSPIVILDYESRAMDTILLSSRSDVRDIALSPNGDFLTVAQHKSTKGFNVYNTENSEIIYTADVPTTTEIVWNNSQTQFAVSYLIPYLEIRDVIDFETTAFLGMSQSDIIKLSNANTSLPYALLHISWGNNDNHIIGGATNGKVIVWDVASKQILYEKSAPSENLEVDAITKNPYLLQAKAVWFTPSDTVFNSLAGDGTYRAWSMDNGDLIMEMQIAQVVNLASVSPGKTKLAYLDEENELHIVEINDLITEQIRSKIDECITNDDFHTKLNDLLDNQEMTGFISQLESADTTSISTECADELIGMANLLLEAETE